MSQLVLARQTALSRNMPVEIRYKYHGLQGSYRVGRGDVYAYPGFEEGNLVKDINYRRASIRAQDLAVPIQRNVNGEINNGILNWLG